MPQVRQDQVREMESLLISLDAQQVDPVDTTARRR